MNYLNPGSKTGDPMKLSYRAVELLVQERMDVSSVLRSLDCPDLRGWP